MKYLENELFELELLKIDCDGCYNKINIIKRGIRESFEIYKESYEETYGREYDNTIEDMERRNEALVYFKDKYPKLSENFHKRKARLLEQLNEMILLKDENEDKYREMFNNLCNITIN